MYKAQPQTVAAPPVYRPQPANLPGVQLKPGGNFRLETRPAPAVYRPQQLGASTPQTKTQSGAASMQTQYQLSSPVWVAHGRQQIRVNIKGSPSSIGSVDVHYNEPGKAYISDLEVAQSHRQHGLGSMLVKAALESARRNGSMATELEANPGAGSISKQALVSMYQKMGFRNTGFSRRGNPKMAAR
jgi:GNAT superfamily N-acetyltransferase